MHIRSFFDPATFTATQVVEDPGTKACVIIDPVLDFDMPSGRTCHRSADAVIAHILERELRVEWILETHAHADHLSAGAYIKSVTGGKLGIGARIVYVQALFSDIYNLRDFPADGRHFDVLFEDGQDFAIGALRAQVKFSPGHTPACVTYLIEDAAFVGDTVFMPDYGSARADFPGGDARTLYRSMREILSLPDYVRIFTCHDYKAPGREEFRWESTVGEQRRSNIHVRDGITEEEFVAMRRARDEILGMPQLLLPSIQVNIRAGALPPVESNGVAYLKIPVDVL